MQLVYNFNQNAIFILPLTLHGIDKRTERVSFNLIASSIMAKKILLMYKNSKLFMNYQITNFCGNKGMYPTVLTISAQSLMHYAM